MRKGLCFRLHRDRRFQSHRDRSRGLKFTPSFTAEYLPNHRSTENVINALRLDDCLGPTKDLTRILKTSRVQTIGSVSGPESALFVVEFTFGDRGPQ
jgi:hypothetical protein